VKLREAFLWQPHWIHQGVILIAGAILVTAISRLHIATGLAYEFHAFYIVPVLAVSWFLGARYGYALSILASVEWFLADRMLAGEPAAMLPLMFNTAVRLTIFISGAWLVGGIRLALLRESRLAREDGLTQLPNRREFHERGRVAFAQAQRQKEPFTAVFIDLDRFKEVNDAMGHGVGDQLLKSVAAAMRGHVRISDIPGRLGGDEFALLLPGMKAAAAHVFVDQLQSRLLDAMKRNGWPVTFSIGVASYNVAPEDFDRLLKQADALMYEVKHGGRNRVLLREF
jgi:diguanylate cyclase (GGDEF)-like protein